MKNKLFKSNFTASMLSFSLCLVMVLAVIYRYFIIEYTAGLKEEAQYISAAVEIYGTDFLENAGKETNTRITIIASDGSVEFDNHAEAEKMDNHADREEIKQAFEEGEGESHRYSSTLAERTVNYAMRLENGSVLRISKTQFSLLYLVANILFPIVLIIAAAIIFSAVIAIKTAEKITEPINKINLENPEERDIYEEIQPLVRRIVVQNKQIHMQMEQLKEEHKKREIHRREFTANVSHELKTPLTSISGFAEIIRDGLVEPEDIPRFADNIHKEAKRLISLVEDIIQLSMVEDKDVKAERTNVDVYKLCQNVMDILSPAAERKNIVLNLDGKSTYIYGVENMLEEIVYNLCDNAIKYNKENGTVTIQIRENEKRTEIIVKDTGIGIPKEDLDRVFERFYRVNKSHSREIGGTGLGLSIVKHSAAYNNGDVSIESNFGRGTTIKVSFRK